ncbi:MAG: Ig-like domain-containing protein [Streptosporangiaceae bacterium]
MRAFVRSHAAKLAPSSRVTRAGLALVASAALAGATLPAIGLLAGSAEAVTDPVCSVSGTVETCVFSYNGTNNTNGTAISWPVPTGVTGLEVFADGAQGGASNAASSPGAGGEGGESRAILTGIPAATTLSIFPGGQGIADGNGGVNQQSSLILAGRGGNSGPGTTSDGGSGGGASSVSIASIANFFANVLVVGGGGGGASSTLPGGNGGTSRHPDGDSGEAGGVATGGGGGTVMGGGAPGSAGLICALLATPGLPLRGGDAGGNFIAGCPNGGGGGGGGYYGGGGGGGNAGSGGGGSAYPGSATTVGGITVTPVRDSNLWTGNGQVTVRYRLISTSTSVSGSPNPSNPSQAVTLTATITPAGATGTVNFEAGGITITGCGSQPVSSGTATCNTSTLPAGSNAITAIFTPAVNSAYIGSQGVTTQVVVTPTSTVLGSSPNPSNFGQSVTLTATVSPTDGGGTVDFKNGGVTISGCGAQPLVDHSGTYSATCVTSTLPGGSNSLTAVYSGDTDYGGSPSNTVTQVVNSVPTRLRAWLVVHPNGTYTLFGQLTSDGSGVSGQTVTFVAGHSGPTLCTTSTGTGGIASCALTQALTRTLLHYNGAFTVSYAGGVNYESSSAYYRGIRWA